MKALWKNYKSSIILLGSIIIGGVIGGFMGEQAIIFKPVGELFLNLLFMTLVPLVFFSVASAIANMGEMKRLGNILKRYYYSIFNYSDCIRNNNFSRSFNIQSDKRTKLTDV